jgi:O-antigen/teichoic acid export membrane protein
LTEALHEGLEAEAAVPAVGFARFTGTSAIFAMGSVVGKVVGFLLLPILTRALTTDDFGTMDVLIALESAIAAPLLLGLDVATVRLYFDQPDQTSRARLVGTSYLLIVSGAILALCVVTATSAQISTVLFGSTAQQPAVIATGLAVVGGVLELMALAVLRAQGRAGRYAAVNAGAVVAYAVVAVVLLRAWQSDVTAVLVAYAAGLFLAGLAGTIFIGLPNLGRPSRSDAGVLLRLGLPLTPAALATYGADFLNRTILLNADGATSVAHFTVALRFASVAAIVVTGFQLALPPRAYALGTGTAARLRLATDARWVVAITGLAVLGLAVFSPEVVVFVTGPAYAAALPALGFCLVFVLAEALFLVASLPSAIARATRDLAIAVAAAVVVSLVGNILLASAWSSTGTAIAVAAGQLVAVAIVWLLGRRRLALPFDWRRLGLVTVVVGTACAGMLAIDAPLAVRMAGSLPVLAVIAWSVPLRDAIASAWALAPRRSRR